MHLSIHKNRIAFYCNKIVSTQTAGIKYITLIDSNEFINIYNTNCI